MRGATRIRVCVPGEDGDGKGTGLRRLYLYEVYIHLSGGRVENHFGKITLTTPDRDLNLNFSGINILVYFESDALDHEGTEIAYSSPMASLVLTDNSQLTVDSFKKLPDQITYPYAEPDDLQKHLANALVVLSSADKDGGIEDFCQKIAWALQLGPQQQQAPLTQLEEKVKVAEEINIRIGKVELEEVNLHLRGGRVENDLGKTTPVHPTEIQTSTSPSSAVELNTSSSLTNYATEAGQIINQFNQYIITIRTLLTKEVGPLLHEMVPGIPALYIHTLDTMPAMRFNMSFSLHLLLLVCSAANLGLGSAQGRGPFTRHHVGREFFLGYWSGLLIKHE
uniref:Uncharacterized protein n=1 Tax=Timema cristinae TaxID=61476 RepID=A0A7R9GXW5_TIMCR|nr:unnamed protein product [Timema cristinae]